MINYLSEWRISSALFIWLSVEANTERSVKPDRIVADAVVVAAEAVVKAAAKKAYDALGIEVYSRVDVLLNSLGDPYVLEANTIPGMTETSLLPMSGKEAGLSFGELCVRIAEISLTART